MSYLDLKYQAMSWSRTFSDEVGTAWCEQKDGQDIAVCVAKIVPDLSPIAAPPAKATFPITDFVALDPNEIKPSDTYQIYGYPGSSVLFEEPRGLNRNPAWPNASSAKPVSAKPFFNSSTLLRLHAVASPGESGGPVSRDDKIVGILVRYSYFDKDNIDIAAERITPDFQKWFEAAVLELMALLNNDQSYH